MSIEIREVRNEDIEILRDIFEDVRSREFSWETDIRRSDFDEMTSGELIYVASMDGEIVGFISIWEPDAFVHNLFVKNSARKCGAGYELLDYTRKQFPHQALTLKCVCDNQQAYRFYLKQGWRVVEEVRDEAVPYYFMEWK